MTSALARYEYEDFLESKKPRSHAVGFDVPLSAFNPRMSGMFEYEAHVSRWAVRKGRAAIFAGCGMGKTAMQCEWARIISGYNERPVLIFAPLVVADQTVREMADEFGITVTMCESMADVLPGINITNYEKLDRFSADAFCGVVLDESSILKAHTGKYRQQLTEWAQPLQYRLCCTATPSPNDHVELATHAEFLGVMRREEMLATFFVHDGGKTSDWRLKGHAVDEFWRWVSTWALAFQKPSDIGFSDEGFDLPPLNIIPIVVESPTLDGYLFPVEAVGLSEQREAKRKSIPSRIERIKDLVNATDEQWLIFSQLNEESESITAAIPDAAEITGADSTASKRTTLMEFLAGNRRVVSSKARIIGFGLNAQCCHNIAVAIDHSQEAFYQLVRRCWRFGQKHAVNVYPIFSEAERGIWDNLQRKEKQNHEMMKGMVRHMEAEMRRELSLESESNRSVISDLNRTDNWTVALGDCVSLIRDIPDESVHLSIFSPPFASLYTYSALDEDMGNCRTLEQFSQHMEFLVAELFRVLKSGRLVSFHCMNLPTSKERDGHIGLKDFRGDLIRMFERHGFIYHSEVCIWKDPVTAMQRTKALGLLHKQIRKDSAMSRQGIPDYLVTMRKPGKNDEAIAGLLEYFVGDMTDEEFDAACREAFSDQGRPTDREAMTYDVFKSIFIWQRYASPVWMDINPSDTLQKESARSERDERHIAPLQLQVIARAIQLWSNPGDLILSPFAGIGSEGHEALRTGRKFLGFELKESYYRQMVRNLENVDRAAGAQTTLFDTPPTESDSAGGVALQGVEG